ncbi:MAG: GGDEF domain-containing protein [Candidatus Aureabacteria bacterium]|nr:GGDEF domain-containing protein [Candidatus Auribacterota bacterium]
MIRQLIGFVFPGGILFFTALVFLNSDKGETWMPSLMRIYPEFVTVLGLIIGWRFNRSKLVFFTMILTVFALSLRHFSEGKMAVHGLGHDFFYVAAILLPLNFLFFFVIKERGILTFHGIFRIVFILIQFPLVFFAFQIQDFPLRVYLEYSFIPKAVSLPNRLPHAVYAAFGILFIVIIAAIIRKQRAFENGFFWATLSVFLGLVYSQSGSVSLFYLSSAVLILAISVIESSHSMAFRDELTGILGRRSLNDYILKLGSTYTIAMVDIDHFKKFNDRYGHATGDDVLRLVASILSEVGGGGKCFRYGGEEFTVVFPGKAAKDAVSFLEGVRERVASSVLTVRNKKSNRSKQAKKRVAVTISIGLAEKDGLFSTPEEVIHAADKALYRAKKSGRNRIIG